MRRDPYRDEPIIAMRDSARTDGPHDWFTDEAAIDFPSIHRLVERVRDAFLAEDAPHAAETVQHEVRLSGHDARRGTIVPLDVPLKGLCRRCGGRGEVWAEPCDDCCGSGDALVHHPIRISVPPGVSHGTRFRFQLNSPNAAPVRVELRVAIAV